MDDQMHRLVDVTLLSGEYVWCEVCGLSLAVIRITGRTETVDADECRTIEESSTAYCEPCCNAAQPFRLTIHDISDEDEEMGL